MRNQGQHTSSVQQVFLDYYEGWGGTEVSEISPCNFQIIIVSYVPWQSQTDDVSHETGKAGRVFFFKSKYPFNSVGIPFLFMMSQCFSQNAIP